MTRAAFPRTRWTAAGPEAGSRDLPEETPVALVHDATTTAVMMATPADLEDFGAGFSLPQGLIAALAPAQELGRATRAAHAAGGWTRDLGLVAAREDVGRHNALDKLVGALARSEARMRTSMDDGLLALTSRVSVEMVQKAAALGAQIVVAVSAPTALAVRTADAAGITLVAVARDDGFEVFTRPDRISG